MKFIKIKIVSPRDVQSVDNITETLLVNIDHIVSIKPIRMVIEDKLINGYWLRTSNGKKYRATEIPAELASMLEGEVPEAKANSSDEAVLN